ncbi:MAG: hypothetical protein MZW92_72960 [Comamonadaceae bacterium]|nr:hypothetical protein [Comamonadaceae bacterium]
MEPDALIRAGDLLVFTGDVTRLDLLLQLRRPGDARPALPAAAGQPGGSGGGGATRTLARRTHQGGRLPLAVRRRGDRRAPRQRTRCAGRSPTCRWRWATRWCWWWGKDFDKRNNLHAQLRRRRAARGAEVHRLAQGLAGHWPASWAVIALSAVGVVGLPEGAAGAAGAVPGCWATRRPADLRRNMPYQIIVIIASALVISRGDDQHRHRPTCWPAVCCAGRRGLRPATGRWRSCCVVTWVLTELMSNNAAAALAFPVALGVAAAPGAGPAALRDGGAVRRQLQLPHALRLPDQPDGDVARPLYAGRLSPAPARRWRWSSMAVALVAIPVVFPFK